MTGYTERLRAPEIERLLREFPAVALLGPRQCGKTTLARELVEKTPNAVYLDLERPADLRKLEDPDLYFRSQREREGVELFCLDEIQRRPEIFPVLRSLIDDVGKNGQFLLLGSASRDLLRQTSESLAGRIVFEELTPFVADEVGVDSLADLMTLWTRGGFPRSYLAASDEASLRWRDSFVRTFLERDIPQLGFSIPAASLHRLWRMLAHHHGQLLNASAMGGALGVSHTTLRNWLDLLSQTFMIRLLEPEESNGGKRLVKSPKVYVRDAGLLHSLIEVRDPDALLGHPARGASWEGLVIENVLAAAPRWRASFYRTRNGAELDLVLRRGQRCLAFECKASTAPAVTRGFWQALDDLNADQAFVVAPVDAPYLLRENVEVLPLAKVGARLAAADR